MIMPTWAVCAVLGVAACYGIGRCKKWWIAWIIPILFFLFAIYALNDLVPHGIRYSVRLAVWIPPILQIETLYLAHFMKLYSRKRSF